MYWGSTGIPAQTTDGMVEGCSGIEDQQVYWVNQSQSFACIVGQRVLKVIVRQAFNTEIGSKRKLWPDLVKRACRVRAFVLGYNIVADQSEGSSSYARLLIFLLVCE